MKVTYKGVITRRSAAYRTALHRPLLAANHDQSRYIRASFAAVEQQVIAREDARDGTLRPRFMIGRYSRCTAWYGTLCTDHCSRQNTTKRVFSTVKTHIRYLVRQFREKGSSDKALRVSSLDYDVARVYMNILASTLNGSNIRVFFLFLSFVTFSFY
jgi:hypothetical protein